MKPSRKTTEIGNNELTPSRASSLEGQNDDGTFQFTIPDGCFSLRLDVALFQFLEVIPSRNFATRLLEAGMVRVNFQPSKASFKVTQGDVIHINLSFLDIEKGPPQPQEIPLSILFEDADLIILNKPAGLVVHPGAGVFSGTLVNAVLAHCGSTLPSLGGPSRAGIVHRLDRNTSGVMVVAKSQLALTGLSNQFASHSQLRIYQALVYGEPQKFGRVETQHGRDPRNRIKYAVLPNGQGKKAILDYRLLQRFPGGFVSCLECKLYTGRTHQIRVQMTHLNHPLLGDSVYGSPPPTLKNNKNLWGPLQNLLTRQMLHAHVLGFTHPRTGKPMSFECPPPSDFTAVIHLLLENRI